MHLCGAWIWHFICQSRTDNTMTKRERTNSDLQKLRLRNTNLTRNRGELRCCGRESSSCFTCGTRRVTLVTNQAITISYMVVFQLLKCYIRYDCSIFVCRNLFVYIVVKLIYIWYGVFILYDNAHFIAICSKRPIK